MITDVAASMQTLACIVRKKSVTQRKRRKRQSAAVVETLSGLQGLGRRMARGDSGALGGFRHKPIGPRCKRPGNAGQCVSRTVEPQRLKAKSTC